MSLPIGWLPRDNYHIEHESGNYRMAKITLKDNVKYRLFEKRDGIWHPIMRGYLFNSAADAASQLEDKL